MTTPPVTTRVLLTGAGGQLGLDLVEQFTAPRIELRAVTRRQLDIADRDQVLGAVGSLRPHLIVNAAAFNKVDACESDPGPAFAVNALGPRHLAEASRRFGAHLVHVSTDYVFDGTSDRPYREWDPTCPTSVYGASKAAGEREAGPEATVVRTSWLHGRGANFLRTILRLAVERDHLDVVSDQHGSPTFTADLAPVVRRLAIDRRPGIFHVTNQGHTTWFELARRAVEAAGLDPTKIRPISTSDYGAPAPRPAFSVLDNAVLRAEGLPLLPSWEDGLRRFLAAPQDAVPGGPHG